MPAIDTPTEQALADLRDILRRHGTELARRRLRIGWCARCTQDRPVRRWPLGDLSPIGDQVCDRCWTLLARGRVVVRRSGRVLHVHTTHPQFGQLYRGSIQAVGVEPRPLRPAVRWRVADYDATDLGVHVGDFADVERMLLDATSGLDEIDPDHNPEEE